MSPAPRPQDIFDELAPRAAPLQNIETRREGQASGEYVQQTPSNWHLPEPVWVRPNRV